MVIFTVIDCGTIFIGFTAPAVYSSEGQHAARGFARFSSIDKRESGENFAGMVGHGRAQSAKPTGELQTFRTVDAKFCVDDVGVYAFGRIPGVEFCVFHPHGHDFGDCLAGQKALTMFADEIFISGDGGGEFRAYFFRCGGLVFALGHGFLQQISGVGVQGRGSGEFGRWTVEGALSIV